MNEKREEDWSKPACLNPSRHRVFRFAVSLCLVDHTLSYNRACETRTTKAHQARHDKPWTIFSILSLRCPAPACRGVLV